MNAPSKERIVWTFVIALAALLTMGRVAVAEVFTLEQAVETALASSLQLDLIDYQTEEAAAKVREARSGFLPQVAVEAGYQFTSEVASVHINLDTPVGAINNSFDMGKHDNYQAKATLTQPLFQGGAILYMHDAAKDNREATRLAKGQTENDLTAQVSQVFYGALLAKETIAVLNLSLENAKLHLADVQKRYDAGYTARADVLRAEVEVNQIIPELAQARQLYNQALIGLRTLMRLDESANVEVQGSLSADLLTPDRALLQTEAATSRPELSVIDKQKQAAQNLIRAERAGWLPKAYAQVAYNYQEPYYFQKDGDDFWTAGVGVSIPVFDGLRTLSRTDQAKARLRQAETARTAQADIIGREVDDALARLTETEKRIASTKGNISLAQEALAMTNDGYREGAATNLDVQDANLKLMQARLAHLQSVYDYRIAECDLERACGRYARTTASK